MRKLVLWGHHVDEYQEMFGLSSEDLNSRLLEYGGGTSAVNAELHARGVGMVSCDPLFRLDRAALETEACSVFESMVQRLQKKENQFDFSQYDGLDGLIACRRQGMATFFSDYSLGKIENRYLFSEDNTLPFPDFSFDKALCSHYLFSEEDEQDVDFHLQIICELARVAKEVRLFPLIDRYAQPSPFLGPILLGLQQEQYGVEVREVNYALQPKGNAMLRVWAQQCQVG